MATWLFLGGELPTGQIVMASLLFYLWMLRA